MSEADIAAQLTAALTAAADREVDAKTALVSVTIGMIAPGGAGSITTSLVRKTRTLVFMNAEFVSEAGATVATASSVHKVVD